MLEPYSDQVVFFVTLCIRMKFLILGNKNSVSVQHLENAILNTGHEVDIELPEVFSFEVSESENGYDKVFINRNGKTERYYANKVDAVILKMGGSAYSLYALQQFQNIGIRVFNDPQGFKICRDKFLTHQILSRSKGIANVITLMTSKVIDYEFITNRLGFPFIAKINVGSSQGKGVYVIRDVEAANQFLPLISEDSILQEYINTKDESGLSSDIRAYVVGDQVVASFQRFSLKNDFRSNYSLSKQGKSIELTESEKIMAVKACKACLCDYAGVDIIRKPEGTGFKSLIVEVNSNASLEGITAITEVNVAGYIVNYIVANVPHATVSQAKNTLENKNAMSSRALINPNMAFDDIEKSKLEALHHGICLGCGKNHNSNDSKIYNAWVKTEWIENKVLYSCSKDCSDLVRQIETEARGNRLRFRSY